MSERLQYLFDRHLAGTLNGEENLELMGMALDPAMADDVKQVIGDAWNKIDGSEDVSGEIQERLMGKLVATNQPTVSRFNWRRISIAASLLIALGTGAYFLFHKKAPSTVDIVKTPQTKDVEAPKVTRAMITLANGQQVLLDSLTVLSQGNVSIEKTADGQIVYNGSAAIVEYNTMVNPRGSKVQPLTLNDGTKVWLNAESSIRFPTAFTGNERKVEVSGEAYFEAAHDNSKPFIVKDLNRGTEVQVLGTRFNVNTYADESQTKVTLLEGSVKINQSVILKPGQQAQITNEVKVMNDANLEQVMAWKNGRFQFDGAGIEDVMRQIARWYDIEVVYEVKPKEQHFGGGISRDVEASKVFKMLESTEAVHFRIEGKKVFVIR